ncbi:PH domain-containing protein [Streptomyces longispororuber]|uniref:PH domain-containing protein n=1 Tax=Streptomyces longispororuber TaxID=68230 RepID=UPI0021090D66|nr:PH domain-containing protein [Streptomyces longispororuber]MCQ4212282.1 PH domain-containing protein [Streptomyces longispororuber]
MTSETTSPDRIYRSPAGIAGGVVLLALGAWLGADAVISGAGRTPWLALAGLLFAVPLVVAFTIRPAVFGNDDRLRVRNPFRMITLPWAAVADFRSSYSNEVFDQAGTKYQLWSIPVSLRARRKAQRSQMRAETRQARNPSATASAPSPGPSSDQAMQELRELHEARAAATTSQGEPTVRWAYEIIAPAAAGGVLLLVLLLLG